MPRFSHYDSDSERLPDRMRRVAYDADTQVYTYRDANGARWEGGAGARYGQLTPVGRSSRRIDDEKDEEDTTHHTHSRSHSHDDEKSTLASIAKKRSSFLTFDDLIPHPNPAVESHKRSDKGPFSRLRASIKRKVKPEGKMESPK